MEPCQERLGFRARVAAFAAGHPAVVASLASVRRLVESAPVDALGTTLIPSALILCARFSFFGALVQLAASRSMRQEQRDIGRVYGRSLWYAWRRGILPQVLPSVLVSFLLIFALSAGELGTTLLICPPGQATLTLKIYNYLHYGASADRGSALPVHHAVGASVREPGAAGLSHPEVRFMIRRILPILLLLVLLAGCSPARTDAVLPDGVRHVSAVEGRSAAVV